jgi:outer membrane protein assembly factor BamB
MTTSEARPLRLWPGVAIVVLQLAAMYLPGRLAPGTMLIFYAMMASFTLGTLLLIIWWLFFSRAPWRDRIGGLVLLVLAHGTAYALTHPSARMSMMMMGIPWLCAVFVGSLFFHRRAVTVVAVLLAGLGWALVRVNGVTGAFDTEYAWRWSATAEQRFLASREGAVPSTPAAAEGGEEETAAWPGFRGPARDGVVAGVTIDAAWAAHPPQELWRHRVGPGWSSFTLVGTRLCTQEQRDELEAVVCYDARDGRPIWVHEDTTRFAETLGGAGPRATPAYHHGRLYTLGATGILNCLDAAAGKLVWKRNLVDDAGAKVPDWGFASSPLIVDDLVLVHAAGAPQGRTVVAYDLDSGEPRWFSAAPGLSYSSPHLTTIDGVRQVVMVTGKGVFAMNPETGEALWNHEWLLQDMPRVLQPTILADGHGMLIGTSFGYGTRRIAVARQPSGTWTAEELWTSQSLKPYFNDLVVHRGTAYGFDGNILAAIDLATGKRVWKGGRYGNGQLLLLPDQDLLVVLGEQGELALVRATPERFEEVAKIQAIEGKTWNHPIVAGGVVYLRNAQEAAAYRLPV